MADILKENDAKPAGMESIMCRYGASLGKDVSLVPLGSVLATVIGTISEPSTFPASASLVVEPSSKEHLLPDFRQSKMLLFERVTMKAAKSEK